MVAVWLVKTSTVMSLSVSSKGPVKALKGEIAKLRLEREIKLWRLSCLEHMNSEALGVST